MTSALTRLIFTIAVTLSFVVAGLTRAATTNVGVDFNDPNDLGNDFSLVGNPNLNDPNNDVTVVNYDPNSPTIGVNGSGGLDVLNRNQQVALGATNSGSATQPHWAWHLGNAFDFTSPGVTGTVSLDFLPTNKLHDSSNALGVGFGVDPNQYGSGVDDPNAPTTGGILFTLKMKDANTGSNNGTDGSGTQITTGGDVFLGINMQNGIFGNSNNDPNLDSTDPGSGVFQLAYTEGAVAPVGSDGSNPGALGFYNPNEDQFHWHRLEGTFETVGSDDVLATVRLLDLGIDGTATPTVIGTFSADSTDPNYNTPDGDFDSNGIVNGLDFLRWQTDPNGAELADWEENYGMGPAGILLRNEADAYGGFFADQARGPGSNKKNRGSEAVDNFSLAYDDGVPLVISSPNVVPEPSSLFLFGMTLMMAGFQRQRRH